MKGITPLDRDYLTVPEIADIAGVTRAAVHRWIRKDKLKTFRVGAIYRITPEDWQAFLSNCQIKGKKRKED